MRYFYADARNIETPKALQIYLQYQMNFPEWYGRNLDALYDMLTDYAEPVSLVLTVSKAPGDEMKSYLGRVKRVLEDAADENNHFSFRILEQ
ncbi:MAG: barstar family protein [Clostridia bacterium]|nr:barstar family protein [Clostridia bacterium]